MDELKPCIKIMSGECWQPIPGWEGYYDASNFGRVRSWYCGGGYKLGEPHIKKIQQDKDGYPFVLLYSDGKPKGYRVSRLCLMAFDGIKDGYEASHIDGDKTNNYLYNLKWETHQENELRKEIHGTRPCGECNGAHKLSLQEVASIRYLRSMGWKLKTLACEFNSTESNISQICRGKTWKLI